MLRFVPDHLKTKKTCKNPVSKLVFVIIYVPNRYNSQEMYEKVFLENGEKLTFVSDCYKNHKICSKSVDNYAHGLEFVLDCNKTHKMYYKWHFSFHNEIHS